MYILAPCISHPNRHPRGLTTHPNTKSRCPSGKLRVCGACTGKFLSQFIRAWVSHINRVPAGILGEYSSLPPPCLKCLCVQSVNMRILMVVMTKGDGESSWSCSPSAEEVPCGNDQTVLQKDLWVATPILASEQPPLSRPQLLLVPIKQDSGKRTGFLVQGLVTGMFVAVFSGLRGCLCDVCVCSRECVCLSGGRVVGGGG